MIFVCNKCGFLWISDTISRCHRCDSADLKLVPDQALVELEVKK